MTINETISSILGDHALAAQSSQYDRTVAIAAISRARRVIDDVTTHASTENLKSELLAALNALKFDYHDPDGEFTNGKGVLGSLINDLSSALPDET